MRLLIRFPCVRLCYVLGTERMESIAIAYCLVRLVRGVGIRRQRDYRILLEQRGYSRACNFIQTMAP